MKLTPEKLTAFCAALAETCRVDKACKAVGVSRVTAYKWRNTMPEFCAAWDSAMKVGITALEDEAHRRAFEGVPEPLVHQGQFTALLEEVRDGDGNPVLDADGKPFDGGKTFVPVTGPTVTVPAGSDSFIIRVPTVDDTVSEPPWACAISFAIVRPIPDP